jgi:DNA-binding NtrC family response regulator
MASRGSVLVVDDDAVFRDALSRFLERQGYAVETEARADGGLDALERAPFDVVITDLRMPGIDGIELVRRARSRDPDAVCIVITGYGTAEQSIKALREGAFWFIDKSYDDLATIGGLVEKGVEHRQLWRRNRQLEQQVRARYGFDNIVGESAALRETLDLVRRVADTEATVLVLGESGTGKELIARALHVESPRAREAFVAVNCGAIPEPLLESELFGHVRGAFTGADRDRAGRFAAARGGTLFLDEIGDMSPDLQRKLLRALQEREFERVGSNVTEPLDARIVSATNRDLPALVRQGEFRSDLYFRLSVVPIQLPALRERAGDIPLLADHFLSIHRRKYPGLKGISDPALKRLAGYAWPGNVRELESVIERAAILRRDGFVTEDDIPDAIQPSPASMPCIRLSEEGVDLNGVLQQLQTDLIRQALDATGWNKNRAAQLLGLKRTTLLEKIRARGLERS